MSRPLKTPHLPRHMAAIKLAGALKSFGQTFTLGPLDLTIGHGITLLEGSNGSGKSTFLALVAGELRPDQGTVRVGDADPMSADGRRRISLVPDVPIFYRDLSLLEHLRTVAGLHDAPGAVDDVLPLADRFGLMERIDDRPVRFSKGMRQKAAILLALVRPFDVLLMDEPLSGLDSAGRATLIDVLENLRRGGRSVVLTSHEPDLADVIDSRLVVADGIARRSDQ